MEDRSVITTPRIATRIVTNADIEKYIPLVEMYLRDRVQKNWNEAKLKDNNFDISLGNTGVSMNDIRQHLLTEVCEALQKYDPERGTKEITFVYTHLFNRCGQLMKRLTRPRAGYGIWTQNLEETFDHLNGDDE